MIFLFGLCVLYSHAEVFPGYYSFLTESNKKTIWFFCDTKWFFFRIWAVWCFSFLFFYLFLFSPFLPLFHSQALWGVLCTLWLRLLNYSSRAPDFIPVPLQLINQFLRIKQTSPTLWRLALHIKLQLGNFYS